VCHRQVGEREPQDHEHQHRGELDAFREGADDQGFTPVADRLRLTAIALICGGAIGNLIDRVRSESGVVDFIDVGVGNIRWPVFNVADIAVTTGAIILALSLWKEEQGVERR
jgi:hypothetical protein